MAVHTIDDPAKAQVYVYEVPLRVWHWINALAIVALGVTGYLIADPPVVSSVGQASDTYLMGYIRFAHFAAGYILIVGFLGRLYWAIAGNEHARQLFLPAVWSSEFWAGVVHEVRWYAFLEKQPRQYLGHNPLALLAMHFMLVWGTLFMIVTGLALYGEGEGMGSWQYRWFSAWVIPLFGQSQDVHTWHHLVMWYLVCFIIVHIYAAVREDKLGKQTLLGAMIDGWRRSK